MGYGLRDYDEEKHKGGRGIVLILVLMEYGLRDSGVRELKLCFLYTVLILVLMEYGLRAERSRLVALEPEKS